MPQPNPTRESATYLELLSIEWITLGLLLVVWGVFIVGTWLIGTLKLWFALPLLAPVITLHSSLVHEAIHGHPTSSPRLNELLLTINPGLFIAYRSFRDSHRAHHDTPELTDPALDTESAFIDNAHWQSLGTMAKTIRRLNTSLMGRLVIGPYYSLMGFAKSEARRIAKDEGDARTSWLLHGAGCVAVLYWVIGVCGISPIAYVLLVAYPAMSLLSLRTYAEHNWATQQDGRTAIVESSWPLSLLFLNNNLHAVHHDSPEVSWYRLPTLYRENRSLFRAQANFFTGYREVFKRYAFRPYAPVVYPPHK